MKFKHNHLLTFGLISPAFFSLLYGLIGIILPVELTMYLFFLVGIFLLRISNSNYKIQITNSWFNLYYLMFISVIIFFLFYPQHYETANNKFLRFLYLVVFKIAILSMIDYKSISNNSAVLYQNLAYGASFTLFLFFIFFQLGFTESYNNSSREILVGFLNPIWFSRFVADFCFILVFFILKYKKFSHMFTIALFMGLFLLFASGSRAPLLSLLITVYILIFIEFKNRRKQIIFFSLFFGLSILPFIITLILNLNIYSVIARQEYILKSITFIMDNPFGYGLSSFGMLASGDDIMAYPHNIFLEILVEIGLIGFLVLLLLLMRAKRYFSVNNIFSFLFIMSFINAQFSGDLAANSYMFIYLFLSIITFTKYNKIT